MTDTGNQQPVVDPTLIRLLLQISTQTESTGQGVKEILRLVSPSGDDDTNRVSDALEALAAAVVTQTDVLRSVQATLETLVPPPASASGDAR